VQTPLQGYTALDANICSFVANARLHAVIGTPHLCDSHMSVVDQCPASQTGLANAFNVCAPLTICSTRHDNTVQDSMFFPCATTLKGQIRAGKDMLPGKALSGTVQYRYRQATHAHHFSIVASYHCSLAVHMLPRVHACCNGMSCLATAVAACSAVTTSHWQSLLVTGSG